jgi:hypothetical protein
LNNNLANQSLMKLHIYVVMKGSMPRSRRVAAMKSGSR